MIEAARHCEAQSWDVDGCVGREVDRLCEPRCDVRRGARLDTLVQNGNYTVVPTPYTGYVPRYHSTGNTGARGARLV